MRVRRVASMSLEDLTVRRCAQECSLAGVQMQVAGGERLISVKPGLSFFFLSLLFSFVLTGVDETKATANESLGGGQRLLQKLRGVSFDRFAFPVSLKNRRKKGKCFACSLVPSTSR